MPLHSSSSSFALAHPFFWLGPSDAAELGLLTASGCLLIFMVLLGAGASVTWPMSKPRRVCIFCGGGPLTHEHIWPAWMLPYLPKLGVVNHETLSETIFPKHSMIDIKKRSGEPQSGQLRIVCQECNNGWMSVLQSEAKPILLPLIQGESLVLHRKAQSTLSAWNSMFVMVAEFMIDRSGTTIGVLEADRRWLKENGAAPKNWKIWIGKYVRQKWKGYWVHNTVPILGEDDVPRRTDLGVDLPNTQSTTAVLGQLYVHALSSAVRSVVRKQSMVREDLGVLPLIWPIKRSPLSWPPPRSLTDQEADSVATALSTRARGQPPAKRLSET
jgi:hypothetical protein